MVQAKREMGMEWRRFGSPRWQGGAQGTGTVRRVMDVLYGQTSKVDVLRSCRFSTSLCYYPRNPRLSEKILVRGKDGGRTN